MSYSHSFENDELDCEVALKMQAKLTVTVKNKHNRDVLNLRCNLLKDIKAYVKQQKFELLPGIHTNSMSGIMFRLRLILNC